MRLIDADELRKGICAECTLYDHETGVCNIPGGECDWDSIYHIDHARTVEAIPIDWIADWLAYNQRRIDDGENADDSVEWMLRAWFIEKDIEREREKRRQRND